jgi:hypothetical protein
MSAIKEHNQICLINTHNNQLLSLIFFEIYFMVGFMIDMLLLQAFHIKNIVSFKLLFTMGGLYVMFLAFILSYIANSLKLAAYSPYVRLNSIVARGQSRKKEGRWLQGILFNLKSKFQIVRLIETLSTSGNRHHQKIAVYCLDLFIIDTFQYFLLTSNIIANYMLFVGLID